MYVNLLKYSNICIDIFFLRMILFQTWVYFKCLCWIPAALYQMTPVFDKVLCFVNRCHVWGRKRPLLQPVWLTHPGPEKEPDHSSRGKWSSQSSYGLTSMLFRFVRKYLLKSVKKKIHVIRISLLSPLFLSIIFFCIIW